MFGSRHFMIRSTTCCRVRYNCLMQWTDGWVNSQISGQMNGWINSQIVKTLMGRLTRLFTY